MEQAQHQLAVRKDETAHPQRSLAQRSHRRRLLYQQEVHPQQRHHTLNNNSAPALQDLRCSLVPTSPTMWYKPSPTFCMTAVTAKTLRYIRALDIWRRLQGQTCNSFLT